MVNSRSNLQPRSEARTGGAPSACSKINVSVVFAGQNVGVRQVNDRIWLVSFMDYDLGYFDDETCRLEPIAKVLPCPRNEVLPMSPEWT